MTAARKSRTSFFTVRPLLPSMYTLTFLVGRHGEGYHNLAEAFYGTEAWDVRLPISTLPLV